jgi:hypothetical protein
MFEQFPKPASVEPTAQEQEPNLEFLPNIGLDEILDILVSMHEQGISLEGSAKNYTAIELAHGINNAINAANRLVRTHDQEFSLTAAARMKAGEHIAPLVLEDLEELNFITRTSGFREAVSNAIQVLSKDMTVRFPRRELPISDHAHQQYEELTGQLLGRA